MSSVSSDCESSYYTESEAESDYITHEEGEPSAQFNHTLEVEDIIRGHVDVTTKNAVGLNHHYKAKLLVLRHKLEGMLSQCQNRMLEVEKNLDDIRLNLTPKTRPARPRHPGYICGQPFFKDYELYPGPHNEDYLYRKNVKKEFFPLDMFESIDTLWTSNDKHVLKDSVANQAYEFVRRETQLRDKICINSGNARSIIKDRIELKTLPLEEIWHKAQAYDGKYGRLKFTVDWLKISNAIMNGRHSAAACEGMWNNYLIPGLKRSMWTPDEESRLVAAVESNKRSNWVLIALSVENRSEYQCFVHYQTNFSELSQIKKMPWTQEEDDLLLRLVNENRIGNNIIWNKIVERMPYRNKVQVYHRYKYTLVRPLRGAKFTAEEDCVITAYVQQFGDDFKFFPEDLLPGRTTKQVRARYMNTLRFVNTHVGWSLEEDKRLMSYIAENLTEEGPAKLSWAECSKYLGNHSRLSCRTRYYTIEKFLERNPNATLENVPRREKKKLSSSVTDKNWIKTIVEIKSAPPVARNAGAPFNPLEVGRPTVAEWSLYEQMKFCFRYKFGYKLAVNAKHNHVYTGTKIVLYLLEGFEEPSHEPERFPGSMLHPNGELFQMMQTVLRRPLDWANIVSIMQPKMTPSGEAMLFCRFPPNYNTVLGLRGLCLNACSVQTRQTLLEPKPKKLAAFNQRMYDQAIGAFVDRFRKIFHWTMLLMMLNIDDVSLEGEESSRQNLSVGMSPKRQDNPTIIVPVKVDKLMNVSSSVSQPYHMNTCAPHSTTALNENNLNIVTNITIIDPKDLPTVPGNVPGQQTGFKCGNQYSNESLATSHDTIENSTTSSESVKSNPRSETNNSGKLLTNEAQLEQCSPGMVSTTSSATIQGVENQMLQHVPTFTIIEIPQEISLMQQRLNASTVVTHSTPLEATSHNNIIYDEQTNVKISSIDERYHFKKFYESRKICIVQDRDTQLKGVTVPLELPQPHMMSNAHSGLPGESACSKVDGISNNPVIASEDIIMIDVDRHPTNNPNAIMSTTHQDQDQDLECFAVTKQNMLVVPYNRVACERNSMAHNFIGDAESERESIVMSPIRRLEPSGEITLVAPLESVHNNKKKEKFKTNIVPKDRNESDDVPPAAEEDCNAVTEPVSDINFDSNVELIAEPLTAVDIIRMLRARHNASYCEDSDDEEEFERAPNN
ncbi:uncharacterized protein LOC128708585 [Anopheles marshallii]|uniref:uncharacterized protein LOC128708585 n=1 Tax=Anopheles marshallii TaxID=1521116 RepID=UPI00237A8EE0|nr:uncharacterized protein LOC128708585 [Anopheles marshallii]